MRTPGELEYSFWSCDITFAAKCCAKRRHNRAEISVLRPNSEEHINWVNYSIGWIYEVWDVKNLTF